MGVDLMSEAGGSFMFNWYGWRWLFDLACRYGWEPQGTIYPDIDYFRRNYPDTPESDLDPDYAKTWNGGYFTNDEQLVTAEDALEMAKAIGKYLSEPNNEPDSIKEYLREFIAFCRRGGFRIW